MNVRHTLICFFLLSLCGGHSGLVSAKPNMFVGAEGGNGTIYCNLSPSGNTKFFCKNKCEDILIRTDGVRAQSGRYSTEYRNDSSGRGILSVTITHLIKSDSGLYRCALGENLVQDRYWDFEIRVLDAALLEEHSVFTKAVTEGENITYQCTSTVREQQKFLCKGDCKKEEDIIIETDEKKAQNGRYSIEYGTYGLYVTITEATMSDTGRYKCGYGRALSPDLDNTHTIHVLGVPSAPTQSGVWLYVGLALAVMVVLLALAVLIYCRKRSSEPREPRVEAEYASVTETNRVYEDIREDRENAAPMELSSAHTYASSQNTADSSKLTYSELNFSNRTAGSSNSAIRADRDNVIYSVPRVEANAVYSTVS